MTRSHESLGDGARVLLNDLAVKGFVGAFSGEYWVWAGPDCDAIRRFARLVPGRKLDPGSSPG